MGLLLGSLPPAEHTCSGEGRRQELARVRGTCTHGLLVLAGTLEAVLLRLHLTGERAEAERGELTPARRGSQTPAQTFAVAPMGQ